MQVTGINWDTNWCILAPILHFPPLVQLKIHDHLIQKKTLLTFTTFARVNDKRREYHKEKVLSKISRADHQLKRILMGGRGFNLVHYYG